MSAAESSCGSKDDMSGLIRDTFMLHQQTVDDLSENIEYSIENVDNLEVLDDISEDMNVNADLAQETDFDLAQETDFDLPQPTSVADLRPPTSAAVADDETSYKRLIEDAEAELYPGCQNYSKLSFTLHLLHIKYMSGWSSKSFDCLMELLVNAFPHITTIPSSFYEAKKVMKDLGLTYTKIDACPRDCMLYWDSKEKKSIEDEHCRECGMSRWKEIKGKSAHEKVGVDGDETTKKLKVSKKKAAKVLRYFPLILRLKRIYMSPKVAEDMIWHEKTRVKDGKLRHPADGLAWKSFDEINVDFAADPRNVRLGLASDGFNPFRTLSTTHSTWPVILFPYNLPPWLCMRRSTLIMSMIIPGDKAPGDKIDTYLQPLIAELCELWQGVDAYDAYVGEKFKLRAALMWTVNDFPAYANLSGWSTKGKFACPVCGHNTHSTWLKHGRKFCYTGSRRWLPMNHPFRDQTTQFDGTRELRPAPHRCSGVEVLNQMEKTTSTSRDNIGNLIDGCSSVNEDQMDRQLWKKKSIFFDLPYWKDQLLRHNLDSMHMEKNFAENLLHTFLFFDKRGKDNENARKDLVELDIKHSLHPILLSNGKVVYPPALYTMTRAEKDMFLGVLKCLKVPDGYASNIARCVNLKERRLMNMKSHDFHILMQDILPIALRASMKSDILELVTQLSFFFKSICAREIDVGELESLQSLIVLVLCKMEKVFPPGFFTIMVHLLIHLVEEVRLGGPTPYRWMYPVERALGDFKSDVLNRAHPEACIAEGTLAKECLVHCSRYFRGVETIFNRPKRNNDYCVNPEHYIFNTHGRPNGKREVVHINDEKILSQAHRYVLLHFDIVEKFRSDFLREKRILTRKRRLDDALQSKLMIEEFPSWFQSDVLKLNPAVENYDLLLTLGRGPNNVAWKMRSYNTRGYKFRTTACDDCRMTQNSGVSVSTLDGQRWYGKIKEIYELDYFGAFGVVLFKCIWVDLSKGLKRNKNGFVMVNFSHLIHTGRQLKDDPFILSSEADQVFYVADGSEPEWSHVMMIKPRDTFQVGYLQSDGEEPQLECLPEMFQSNIFDDTIELCRNDVDINDVGINDD